VIETSKTAQLFSPKKLHPQMHLQKNSSKLFFLCYLVMMRKALIKALMTGFDHDSHNDDGGNDPGLNFLPNKEEDDNNNDSKDDGTLRPPLIERRYVDAVDNPLKEDELELEIHGNDNKKCFLVNAAENAL
jgi:hypothetical protein